MLTYTHIEKGRVYLPKFLGILGGICCVPFLILTIVAAWKGESLWTIIAALLLSTLGGSMVIAYVNCRISYDEEGFRARNFVGIRRQYTYDQVTGIRENPKETFLYMGKHRIMVDELAIGGQEFIQIVKKEYKKSHNGQPISKILQTKWDPFRGNVTNPGAFLFAYISVGIICAGFLIFAICDILVPATPRNTVEQTLSFQSCRVEENEILLTTGDHRVYKVQFIDEEIDALEIQALCDKGTTVTAYSEKVVPKGGGAFYSIKAILLHGEEILSFEDTNRLYRQAFWPFVLIAALFCLCWGAYVVASVVVGRNPWKYSKRTVKLFFQDGFIKR